MRVAQCFADDLKEYLDFHSILKDFQFVPGGRMLSGANSKNMVTYYNCFVIGIDSEDSEKGNDSRKGIMNTISKMIEITARGGGVGINWSTLRPEGSHIRGVNGKSSGANSWMRGADGLADQIRQGGSRTAALMFMLDDWHPDILKFINPTERFKRANFSVNVSEKFMQAVREDGMWELMFPDISCEEYNREWDGDLTKWIDSGYPVRSHGKVKAKEMWHDICDGAYRTGSPGVVFLGRCNAMSNTWYFENLVCTNPCGEQPLPVGGCCNLGSINLTSMWNPYSEEVDWARLEFTVKTAVRFLDNVIDKSLDITKEIGDVQRGVRRVGLGTMGLADLLILKKLRYGSTESLKYISKVYSFIRDCAYSASVDLAIEKGPAPKFAAYYNSGEFIKQLPESLRMRISQHGIRNLQLLTQPPTGTTSILSGVSNGIEPIFSKKYTRKDATGEHKVTHPLFEGKCGKHLVTAKEITPRAHLFVQAEVQKYVDSSISKTINLPSGCTIEDIGEAYLDAFDLGCKGVTVYRTGSLGDVLVDDEEEPVCESCQI